MIRGTAVTVLRPSAPTVDRLGNEVPGEPVPEVVENVLVVPGATADMEASRPAGVTVALTLHFPKAYAASLRGCSVELAAPWAGTYRVIGDPQPYMDDNTPTPWNRPVEVEVAHG
jgi:hypothetical protein